MRFFPIVLCLLLPALGHSAVVEEPAWAAYFAEAGVEGTLVLWNGPDRDYRVHHAARAAEGFLPASTFKIPHALIALETGVLADENQVLPWDGTERSIAAWNRDHRLRSAVRHSVVPVFQAFAREIGPGRMQDGLDRLDYGNRDLGGGLDQFWLEGALRISALEQVRFLHRLQTLSLSASERAQRVVREALLDETRDGVALYAKTGYTGVNGEAIGWWVGWVEGEEGVTCFACNLTLDSITQAPLRLSLIRAILLAEGILPASWTRD